MHIILGSTSDKSHLRIMAERNWGRMWIPTRKPSPVLADVDGLDTGAYVCWTKGTEWDADQWWTWLHACLERGKPYLAVLPDIVTGGLKSLEMSLGWLDHPDLPELPWYLAVQDGMKPVDVEPHIHRVAGLFLGGSDPFKLTAPDWSEMAHQHSKRFHYARMGTRRKLRLAHIAEADSGDSAFPLWKKERMEQFCRWAKQVPHEVARLKATPTLF